MNTTTKSIVGLSIGAAVAGGAWYYIRTQDRAKLVDLLKKDAKIPIATAAAAVVQPPGILKNVIAGDFEAEAEQRLPFADNNTPEAEYAKIEKQVDAYIQSLQTDTLSQIADMLGLPKGTLEKLQNFLKMIFFYRKLEFSF
jgi:hypothetical protein